MADRRPIGVGDLGERVEIQSPDRLITEQASITDNFTPPVQATPPSSPTAGQLWFNTTTGWNVLMVYDGVRAKWMSVGEFMMGWGRDGANGNYLLQYGIGVAQVGTGVLLPRDATVRRISVHAAAGNATKAFDLLINDVSALSFSLVASEYINNATNIDVDQGERLWVSASASGTAANDVVVTIWVSWRV
jgi:hypothetical protein